MLSFKQPIQCFLILTTLSLVNAQVNKPHLIAMLMDDFGWANVGYHRTPADDPRHEVQTPNMDALVASGLQLDRFYAHKFCSPTRSALQTGRSPIYVNVENSDIGQSNLLDPVSGFQGIPRNMTGLATKLKTAGYMAHMVGKWHRLEKSYFFALSFLSCHNSYPLSSPPTLFPKWHWLV